MYKEIMIGETAVPMKATAATLFYYKRVFGRDFLQDAQGNLEGTDALRVGSMIGYIMARQAAGADMGKLKEEELYAWLDAYDPMDFINAVEPIMELYTASATPSVVPKKKAGTLPAR